MLRKCLDQHLTCYHQKFNTWQEAVAAGCEPMIKNQIITTEYIDQIVSSIEKYGPYIVIAPNIAMPHSTESAQGVLKTAIGFMKVEEPVHFEEGNPEKDARLFFTLAAENHEEHLKNMMDLVELLQNEEIIEDLLSSSSDGDLLQVIEKYHL